MSTSTQRCRRCKIHDITSDLRGHKNQCQFKDCSCLRCLRLVQEQRVTAAKVANFRKKAKQPVDLNRENDGETG